MGYGIGYDFKKVLSGENRAREWFDGKVVDMGEQFLDRLVEYNNGSGSPELLNVEDLRQ